MEKPKKQIQAGGQTDPPAGRRTPRPDPTSGRGLLRRIRPYRTDPRPGGCLRHIPKAPLPFFSQQGSPVAGSLQGRHHRALQSRMVAAVEGSQPPCRGTADHLLRGLFRQRPNTEMAEVVSLFIPCRRAYGAGLHLRHHQGTDGDHRRRGNP